MEREEKKIVEDLSNCINSQGYIYALAFLYWQEMNVQISGNKLNQNDLASRPKNLRIGENELVAVLQLFVDSQADRSYPGKEIINENASRTIELLKERREFVINRCGEYENKLNDKKLLGQLFKDLFLYIEVGATEKKYLDAAIDKYEPVNDLLKKIKGFDVKDAVLLARAIKKIIALKINNVKTEIDNYKELVNLFTISKKELLSTLKLSETTINRFLNTFTYQRRNKQEIFDFSDLRVKGMPLIKLNDDEFVLFNPAMLANAIFVCPYHWLMKEDTRYISDNSAYSKNSENIVAKQFIKIFGKQNVYKNVTLFKSNSDDKEVDILIQYGGKLIIVEVKSKRLTYESKKGDLDSIFNDYNKSFINTFNQCKSAFDKIKSNEYKILNKNKQEIIFKEKISEFFLIPITTEHYESSLLQQYVFRGLVTNTGYPNPFFTDLFILLYTIEIFKTPLEFISYIAKRARYHNLINPGHEIMILGSAYEHNLFFDKKSNTVPIYLSFVVGLIRAKEIAISEDTDVEIPLSYIDRYNGTYWHQAHQYTLNSNKPEIFDIGLMLLGLTPPEIVFFNHSVHSLLDSYSEQFEKGLRDKHGKPMRRTFDLFVVDDFTHQGQSAILIHFNFLLKRQSLKLLIKHCKEIQYQKKIDVIYGFSFNPIKEELRFATRLYKKWEFDSLLEKETKKMPQLNMPSIPEVSKNSFFPPNPMVSIKVLDNQFGDDLPLN